MPLLFALDLLAILRYVSLALFTTFPSWFPIPDHSFFYGSSYGGHVSHGMVKDHIISGRTKPTRTKNNPPSKSTA